MERGLFKRLRSSGAAFFGGFGRLTAVQRASIGAILDGKDVLVCAPTAAGKTEAAFAPLLERLLRAGASGAGVRVLAIAPTRALVNDLYERLHDRCRLLTLRLERRTGEYEVDPAKCDVLITTPESFDSLLCRVPMTPPHPLASVDAIVLDEIHLLAGSARGEQVRWLLGRLELVRRRARGSIRRTQRVGLSATLPDPEQVAAQYMHDGTVIRVPGQREIVRVATAEPTTTEHALPPHLSTSPVDKKVLVFAHSRARADELQAVLPALVPSHGVRLHHSSVPKQQREATERELRTDVRLIVIATSTLEIGIDIGDIDLVVLDSPAPNVRSLLQRIGRGNRRAGQTRVLCCIREPSDEVIHEAMLAEADAGRLDSQPLGSQGAVVRQQLASFTFAADRRERPRDEYAQLGEEMACPGLLQDVLAHMQSSGELVDARDGVALGELWLENRRAIHSTIEQPAGTYIIDGATGERLLDGVRLPDSERIRVGQKEYRVTGSVDGGVEAVASRRNEGGASALRYATKGAADPTGQVLAVRSFLGIADDVWPVVETDGGWIVFHLGGARRRAILSMARPETGRLGKVTDWMAVTDAAALRFGTQSLISLLSGQDDKQLSRLERMIGRPWATSSLPRALRIQELRAWLGGEGAMEAVCSARMVCASPEFSSVLLHLAQR